MIVLFAQKTLLLLLRDISCIVAMIDSMQGYVDNLLDLIPHSQKIKPAKRGQNVSHIVIPFCQLEVAVVQWIGHVSLRQEVLCLISSGLRWCRVRTCIRSKNCS